MTVSQPAPLSIDDIFRRTVAAKPAAAALIDPTDKMRVTGDEPLRLSFREADAAVSALARHFIESGLAVGSTVAVQLPNTVEAMLVALAAFRAGLVLTPIPLLWRQFELSDALNRIGARSFITSARISGVDHCDLAMNAAADTFSIRHVGVFGDNLPDGISPLTEIMRQPVADAAFPASDPRRASLLTFEVTAEGLRPVPRAQVQLIAGGLSVFLEGGLAAAPKLMSAVLPSSFAGLCASLMPWLLCGNSLTLHHPLDPDILIEQLAGERCAALLAPAALALRLNEAQWLGDMTALRSIVGFWRTPEQVAASPEWLGEQAFYDLYAFGEAGLVVAARDAQGNAAGLIGNERPGGPSAGCELSVTPHGTLALRGPMTAAAAYAATPDGDGSATADARWAVDTGYAAKVHPQSGAITITAPPAGIVAVGGYRFLPAELNAWAQRLPQGGMLAALPDRLNGQRLAGRAGDHARARALLAELGLNPLMVEAFRDRKPAGSE